MDNFSALLAKLIKFQHKYPDTNLTAEILIKLMNKVLDEEADQKQQLRDSIEH